MYVFLADGFEEIEALAPVDVMRRAGLSVTTVSVTDNRVVNGAHGIPVVADASFDALDYADAALLFLQADFPVLLTSRHTRAWVNCSKPKQKKRVSSSRPSVPLRSCWADWACFKASMPPAIPALRTS